MCRQFEPEQVEVILLIFVEMFTCLKLDLAFDSRIWLQISNSPDASTAPDVAVKMYIVNDGPLDDPISIDASEPTKVQKTGSSDVTVWSKQFSFVSFT